MSAQAAARMEPAESYNEVPYESYAYPLTHPQHLNTVATLFGMTPPDFKTANVLELGCAGGGNLLPLAMMYPAATFTGIDLSPKQIDQAQGRKKALKLDNIEFMQQDIMKFSPKKKGEKFDYIICHGILSWVPAPVREKIFSICNEYLGSSGLAVVSYNALPGWNAVRSLREMMLYHTGRFSKPEEKIQQARSLLDFLAENVAESNAGYRDLLENERKMLKSTSNTYLFHDHLEAENTQFYLHDFVRMAQEKGLDYVGDSNIPSMYTGNIPVKAAETLKALDNIVVQEQYMDFVTNRRFRHSILCRKGQALSRALQNGRIMDYFLTMNPAVKITGDDPKQTVTFSLGDGNFQTHDAIAGTLFMELAACGQTPVAATDLVARVRKKMALDDSAVKNILIELGIQLFLRGFVSLRSDNPPCTAEVAEKPVALRLAHLEVTENLDRSAITNARGFTITSDTATNLILKNLDGTRTVKDLADIFVDNIRKGVLNMSKDGKPVTDPDTLRIEATRVVEAILQKLAQNGLLTAA